MSALKIIEQARAEGVSLTLSEVGTIKVQGDPSAVTRWLPIIREHKPELITLLSANENQIHPVARVAQLCNAFYNHIMGPGKATNCCYAPVNRYCAEGKRLRDAYYGAVS